MEKGTCDKLDKVAKRSQDKGTFSVYFNLALQHTMLLMLFKLAPIPVPVRHGLLSTYYYQAKSCVVPLNCMGTSFTSTPWGYCIYCSFMKKLRHRYAWKKKNVSQRYSEMWARVLISLSKLEVITLQAALLQTEVGKLCTGPRKSLVQDQPGSCDCHSSKSFEIHL